MPDDKYAHDPDLDGFTLDARVVDQTVPVDAHVVGDKRNKLGKRLGIAGIALLLISLQVMLYNQNERLSNQLDKALGGLEEAQLDRDEVQKTLLAREKLILDQAARRTAERKGEMTERQVLLGELARINAILTDQQKLTRQQAVLIDRLRLAIEDMEDQQESERREAQSRPQPSPSGPRPRPSMRPSPTPGPSPTCRVVNPVTGVCIVRGNKK